jgi:predicted nucleotidyltransferase
MSLDLQHYNGEELTREIKSIFENVFTSDSYDLFYFGSRVSGLNSSRSDIDLGFANKNGQIMSSYNFFKISEDLESIRTLYKIDFVDFGNVGFDFKKEALSNIQKI